MPATEICAQLMAWSGQYPVPSAPAGQNEAARAAEDRFLARFAGLVSLDRDQVAELVGWKFQTMAHRRALAALRGLRLIPPGPEGFRLSDWLPYLSACRMLARQCGLSLREVDRALWIGAAGQSLPGHQVS